MKNETRSCQSCKQDFVIEREDFDFYEKMKVPAPTFCPQCRMIRRFIFRNERILYRRKDDRSGEEIFSGIHEDAPYKVHSQSFYKGYGWDPLEYGRDVDFSKPFLQQFKELINDAPWPSRNVIGNVDSEYCNNAGYSKNCYLSFGGSYSENSAYIVGHDYARDCFDMYQARHSELCYDGYMVDESFRVFYSTICEECTDVWFSKNLTGCTNCFGCVNLRGKSNYIFNQPVSKEEYKKFIDEFKSGSFSEIEAMRKKCMDMWEKYPNKFNLVNQAVNSTGEHIEHVNNVREGYFVHDAENLKYCQMSDGNVQDCYDALLARHGSSECYETAVTPLNSSKMRFAYNCYPSCNDLEYCFECYSSSNLFGCIGLSKKNYCILNKQYSKEEYMELRKKIIQHMKDVPYIDDRGHEYRYGEFFTPEFSPFAYNETIAQDFFPLSKEEAVSRGYTWREDDKKEFNITVQAKDLVDNISDIDDSITKEVIGCMDCGKAYRIIPLELDFYRRIKLPIPRRCIACRFSNRFKLVNPPQFWERKCQCGGEKDDSSVYKNEVEHFHGMDHCPNEFRSSFEPSRPDIVYCEDCYKTEVV